MGDLEKNTCIESDMTFNYWLVEEGFSPPARL